MSCRVIYCEHSLRSQSFIKSLEIVRAVPFFTNYKSVYKNNKPIVHIMVQYVVDFNVEIVSHNSIFKDQLLEV